MLRPILMSVRKAIITCSLVACVSVGLLTQSACSPASIQTVLVDIQDVVNFASGIIVLVQGFGVLSSPQDQADAKNALLYAQRVDSAASMAVTEANSHDDLAVKISTIYTYFEPLNHISTANNQKIQGAMQLTVAGVELLIQQLKANGASVQKNIAGPTIPFTAKAKLTTIKRKADAGYKDSAKLLAGK